MAGRCCLVLSVIPYLESHLSWGRICNIVDRRSFGFVGFEPVTGLLVLGCFGDFLS